MSIGLNLGVPHTSGGKDIQANTVPGGDQWVEFLKKIDARWITFLSVDVMIARYHVYCVRLPSFGICNVQGFLKVIDTRRVLIKIPVAGEVTANQKALDVAIRDDL